MSAVLATPVHIYMPSFAGGGAENALVRLANYWVGEGRSVTILVNNELGPVRARLDERVAVVSFGTRATTRALPNLCRWLRKERPRLLVTALLSPNVFGLLAARLVSPGTKVVALVRAHTRRELAGKPPYVAALLSPMLRWAYSEADAVGCVAEDLAKDLRDFLGGRSPANSLTTYNPVPFPTVDASGETPEDWPTDQSAVIVAVGRLVPQKDYPTLLRAFADLHYHRPVRLLVLGDGPLLPNARSLCHELGIADRVHFLGYKKDPDRYVGRADVFALVSAFEGFPNVVAEALALGRTVVATDAPGGAGEILGSGAWGYLARPGDPASVARALEAALHKPIEPELARARAAEFSTPAIAERYQQLFDLALGVEEQAA